MIEFRSDILVSVGSNQETHAGDPRETVRAASREMVESGLVIRCQSPIYRTAAYPLGSGPDFANAVVHLESSDAPTDILATLHRIEAMFQRERHTRWAPRTLDLDLLAMGACVLPEPKTQQTWMDLPLELQSQTAPQELILPHPRLQDRAFVLIPMADVAPDWRHPVLGRSVTEMRDALPDYLKSDVRLYE